MIDKDMSAMAGEAMSSLLTVRGASDEYITDRLSVADLWLILDHLIPVVRDHLIREGLATDFPAGLSPQERLVWSTPAVREAIRESKKIQAIKEARSISLMGLKEAKETVEKMEAVFKATGGTRWVL